MKKKIFILVAFIILSVGCATTSNIMPTNDMNTVIEQLGAIHNKSIEAQRKIAEGILDYVMFHLGFWEVMIETSHVRPQPKVLMALAEIKKTVVKRDVLPPGEELSDYDMSRTVGWGLVLFIGIVEHIPTNSIPQMTRLLGLF